jgi:hypothetical protein
MLAARVREKRISIIVAAAAKKALFQSLVPDEKSPQVD